MQCTSVLYFFGCVDHGAHKKQHLRNIKNSHDYSIRVYQFFNFSKPELIFEHEKLHKCILYAERRASSTTQQNILMHHIKLYFKHYKNM